MFYRLCTEIYAKTTALNIDLLHYISRFTNYFIHKIYQNYPSLPKKQRNINTCWWGYRIQQTASGRPVMRIFSEILFSLGPIFEHKKQWSVILHAIQKEKSLSSTQETSWGGRAYWFCQCEVHAIDCTLLILLLYKIHLIFFLETLTLAIL